MLISPAKAIELYQVSKPTLYSDMKSGKLSYKKDDRGKRKLEVSELERVYNKRHGNISGSENVTITKMGKASDYEIELEKKLLEQKVQFLEQQIKTKDETIEQWIEAHTKAQKTADKITALIEDQSAIRQGRGVEQEKIEALEKTIQRLMESEEERRKQNEERRARILAKRKEQEQKQTEDANEKPKTWWGKVFK